MRPTEAFSAAQYYAAITEIMARTEFLAGTLELFMVVVAQLVRALGCGPSGWEFKSPRPPRVKNTP